MPSKITCTRRLQFAAGHRVYQHESKCAHLHGHNYVVHITAEGGLDPLGRVIDFSVLKEKIGTWIDENWDHGFIVNVDDIPAMKTMQFFAREADMQQKFFVMPYNPTAENMARYLLLEVCPELLKDTGVTVAKIVVEETENCSATCEL